MYKVLAMAFGPKGTFTPPSIAYWVKVKIMS